MHAHKILIVDDDGRLRRALKGIFERMGWQVDEAASVSEGLQLLESTPEPCCIVLDLMLPDGRGEALVKRVRERGLRSRLVVCTGVVSALRLADLDEHAPDLVLTKPVSVEDIWDGLCRVCDETAEYETIKT
jgi:CheY-like chemotaxis protein